MKPTASLHEPTSPRWHEFLSETPHDFYHLPGYAELCAAQERGLARALYVQSDRGRLLLPLVIRPIEGTDRVDATSPYGYPGPLVDGAGPITDDALLAGIDALRAIGVVSIFVRSHPLLNDQPPTRIGLVVRHGDTVSIDLRLSPEELARQLRHNHRQDIRRAEALGFRVRVDAAFEHLATFKRLYRATMNRRSASPFYCFTDTYFERLRDLLGARLHLLVAESGSEVGAAGLFVETDGIVEYHLSAVDDAFVRSGACKLLVRDASTWAKARGNRHLHLGGGIGAADDSLLRYKRGFSPLRHPFWTWRVVIDDAEYSRLCRRHDPAADPGRLDGFFPAYRAG